MRPPWKWLPASGWKRWLGILLMTCGGFLLLVVTLVISVVIAWQNPVIKSWAVSKLMTFSQPAFQEEAESAPPPTPSYRGFEARGADVREVADIYRNTNVWRVELAFTEAEWTQVTPRRIPPLRGFMQRDGRPQLRNTNALRNGLAGVLGFEFPWASATVDLGGVVFTNAGVRVKGNGTFLASLGTYKHPYKVELNHHVKGQKWAGKSTFNFGNLTADFSHLADALGYEFYREAGVPAPRTAYARLFLTIPGRADHRLLGPYVMAENPDETWARERFGKKTVALFKPVTHELFSDLGTNWNAYAGIYDPKTKLTPEQEQQVIRTAQFVTRTSDADFAARLATRFDLEEIARFFACETLLSNYDGIYSTGQNFLMYLDSDSGRLGFIPWDLDHCWGEFGFLGNAEQREHSDIWHPWVWNNRFLERLFAAAPFREAYARELNRLLETQFVPARLHRRVDTLAAVVRPLVAEASTNRLARFEIAVSSNYEDGPRDGEQGDAPDRPVWQIKRFIDNRARSVRDQLGGKVKGVRVVHDAEKDTPERRRRAKH